MELDFAILAKAAEVSASGMVSLVGGGFDGVAVEKLPAMVPPFSIVGQFSADPSEVNKDHSISFELVTPAGVVRRFVDRSPIAFASTDLEQRRSHSIGVAQIGFKFEEAGRYQIRIYTNDDMAKTLDLYVIEQSKLEQAEK